MEENKETPLSYVPLRSPPKFLLLRKKGNKDLQETLKILLVSVRNLRKSQGLRVCQTLVSHIFNSTENA